MARNFIIIKKIKSVDKYQVIKELIKSIYHKHIWIQEDYR
jgi:hypothetical protein